MTAISPEARRLAAMIRTTLDIPPADDRRTPQEALRDALGAFVAGSVSSQVPAPVWNALRSPHLTVAAVTVGGVPVTLTAGPGALSVDQAAAAWDAMLAAAPAAGSCVRVTGTGVLVDPPAIGGAA